MAVYVIVDSDNKSGWTDDPAMRFNYGNDSKSFDYWRADAVLHRSE